MKEFKEIETTKENGETKMNMKETSKKAAKKVEKYTGFFLRFMRKYNQVWRGFI